MSTDPRIEAAAKAIADLWADDTEYGSHEDMAAAAIAAIDKDAVITTREQFEALPRGTVVRDYIGQVAERQEDFWANTLSGRDRPAVISFPASVIHRGTE